MWRRIGKRFGWLWNLPCLQSQGEDQKKLDVVSNDVFCNALRSSGRTGTIASEEEDVPVAVEETNSGVPLSFALPAPACS